jgi:hypothetical protein
MSREDAVDLQIYKAIRELMTAVNRHDVITGTIKHFVEEKIESLEKKRGSK